MRTAATALRLGLLDDSEFYPHAFSRPDWPAILEQRRKHPAKLAPQKLAEGLQAQYHSQGVPLTQQQEINLQQLAKGAFTVTTGQQPMLFGGPMYMVYKALKAVHLCRKLQEKFPDERFVPIFWIGGEDHDWAEVNHTYGPGFRWVGSKGWQGGAVGNTHISAIQNPHGLPLPRWLQATWGQGERWGDAFARTLHHWLGGFGILPLQSTSRAFKTVLQPVLEREFLEGSGGRRVFQMSQQLTRAGVRVQALPQEGNFFLLGKNSRKRLDPAQAGGGFKQGTNTRLSREKLMEWVNSEPERFSPNVFFRPLYQELLLPNVAYVGGRGELSYWVQLAGVFREYDTPFPALVERSSVLLLPHQYDSGQLAATGYSLLQALEPLPLLRRTSRERLWSGFLFDKKAARIVEEIRKWEQDYAHLNESVARSIAGTATDVENRLLSLKERISRTYLQQMGSNYRYLWQWRQHTQPNGSPQERLLNPGLLFGEKINEQIDWLANAIDYDETQLQVIRIAPPDA